MRHYGHAKDPETGLTEKMQAFCVEFVRCCNASEAYRIAYDAPRGEKWPGYNAYKLLQDERIKAFIAELREHRKSFIVLNELYIIERILDLSERARDDDKGELELKCMVLLGKHMDMWNDNNRTLEVKGGLSIDYGDKLRKAFDYQQCEVIEHEAADAGGDESVTLQ